MSTLFDVASELLYQNLSAVSGERGRYGREGMGGVEVTAIRGRKDEQSQFLDPAVIIDDQSERVFRAADLLLDGQLILPEEDDTWTVIKDNGTEEVYHVLRPTESDRCWTSSDHNEQLIRVYMQRKQTQEMPT